MKQASFFDSDDPHGRHTVPAQIRANGSLNKLNSEDRSVHDWYRFVLSFPPHLVNEYLTRFAINRNHLVLDPFCGTGTTLVEAKKKGIPSIGIEANPMAHFASSVKLGWKIAPDGLLQHAKDIFNIISMEFKSLGIYDEPLLSLLTPGDIKYRTLDKEKEKLLLKDSISPLPMHKALLLLEHLERESETPFYGHEKLAFAKALVNSMSNLRFGPEVGVGTVKKDAPVLKAWMDEVKTMTDDLRKLASTVAVPATVFHGDARQLTNFIEPASIYLKAYASMAEVKKGLTTYFTFYNEKRWHQNFDRKTPAMVYYSTPQRQAAA